MPCQGTAGSECQRTWESGRRRTRTRTLTAQSTISRPHSPLASPCSARKSTPSIGIHGPVRQLARNSSNEGGLLGVKPRLIRHCRSSTQRSKVSRSSSRTSGTGRPRSRDMDRRGREIWTLVATRSGWDKWTGPAQRAAVEYGRNWTFVRVSRGSWPRTTRFHKRDGISNTPLARRTVKARDSADDEVADLENGPGLQLDDVEDEIDLDGLRPVVGIPLDAADRRTTADVRSDLDGDAIINPECRRSCVSQSR